MRDVDGREEERGKGEKRGGEKRGKGAMREEREEETHPYCVTQ